MEGNGAPVAQTEFYEDLVKAIAEPEPMVLVLVRFAITEINTFNDVDKEIVEMIPEAVTAAIHERMSENLRPYDLLSRVEESSFVAALKTMADEDDLEDRLQLLRTRLGKPYEFRELEAVVDVQMGQAVRRPGEKPSSLLKRADQSITSTYHR